MLRTVVPVIIAYLVGGVPFGLLIARAFGVSDIRAHGSGNIGATNVWRVIGPQAAIWVYVLDIGKGALVVLVARQIDQSVLSQDIFLVICALSAILGHVFPLYLRFKGGKGVSTALGAVIVLLPLETAAGIGFFLLIVLATRYISLGSMIGALVLPVVILVEKLVVGWPVADIYLYMTLLIALLVIVTHRQNICRLFAGTESRFSFTSRPDGAGSHG